MLQFCSTCDNALSIVLRDAEPKQLCSVCSTVVPLPPGLHVIWEKLGTAADAELYRQYLDPEIHNDPTVAQMHLPCPHCKEERVVRYVRYGSGLNFLYACPFCRKFWIRSQDGVVSTPTM